MIVNLIMIIMKPKKNTNDPFLFPEFFEVKFKYYKKYTLLQKKSICAFDTYKHNKSNKER